MKAYAVTMLDEDEHERVEIIRACNPDHARQMAVDMDSAAYCGCVVQDEATLRALACEICKEEDKAAMRERLGKMMAQQEK